MLVESKDAQQKSTEQNSTCISQSTLKTSKMLPCSSKVILNEENKLVCPETNPERHNSLEHFVTTEVEKYVQSKSHLKNDTQNISQYLGINPAVIKSLYSNTRLKQTTMQNEKEDKDREASSDMKNRTLSVTLNPILHQVISTVTKATLKGKAQNENESIATSEQKSSEVPTNFNKTCDAALDNTKMENAKIDDSNSSAVTALESNLIKSVTSSISSKMSQGKKDGQQCKPNESVMPPLRRLSLENNTAAEVESCSPKVFENIEKETQKSKLTSSLGSSALQENEPLEKIVKNQLVSNKGQQEAEFNERHCSLTDSVAVNIPYILQKLDNDLVDSTKVTSLFSKKQMDSSELTKIKIPNNTGSSQAFGPFIWASTVISTKQQEHPHMQTMNLITQPLVKPLIQTKMKKPRKRQNPTVSSICKQNDYSCPTVLSIIPSTESQEVKKINKPAVKCKILPKSTFVSRKRRRKNSLTNSVAPEPMNNKLVTEEVPLEKRIVITNSGKEPLQETVSVSIERKVDPTTVTISESVPGAQKILSVQKSICPVQTQSIQENISMYKPVAVTLNSKNSMDNMDTRTLKVISLSENLSALNLIDTTDDSTTLKKSVELNLTDVKQTNVLDINNSNESAPPLIVYSNPKQPLYRLELLDSCENSVGLSAQQLNCPVQTISATATNCQLINTAAIPTLYKPILNGYNLYSFPYKPDSTSVPIKTGVRYAIIKCNTNPIRPREIKIAPKTPNETAVSGNNTNVQYVLNSGSNTQSVNNVNECPKNPSKLLGSFTPLTPISSLTPINSNQFPCTPLLPLAEQTKTKIPVIKPVQEYPEIKIVDVRTDINKEDISDIPRSTNDIVQIQSPEMESGGISRNTNNLVQIQSPEMEIVSAPKKTNDVQIKSPEMDTMNQDSNPSQVQCNPNAESSISELIDQEPRMFQVEVQVPQTMSESTRQQKSNPSLIEQNNAILSAVKNMSNAIAARQIIKHNKTVSERRKLMLLEKEAMQKRRIDMLQHVFQVLNHCARMCAVEDFEVWFKKEEPPMEQREDTKDVQQKQEITHVVNEKPGEWVGLLKVLKVRPINENEMPKRRRSSKTVTQRKQNWKRTEVILNGSAQKRKSNMDQDATVADLPGTSSKIRKFKRNDSVMEESSSSIISSKDFSENLELPTTEEQEKHFMTYDDQKLNEDELSYDRERLKTDRSNDAETGVVERQQKRKPGRPRKSETQKKHETPTRVRIKRGRPRKWITESPKEGESEFIFSEDVNVKPESIKVEPDMSNYHTWNDEKLCQNFDIQECYVRLRRVEELYPSGYSCIDFDAIFS